MTFISADGYRFGLRCVTLAAMILALASCARQPESAKRLASLSKSAELADVSSESFAGSEGGDLRANAAVSPSSPQSPAAQGPVADSRKLVKTGSLSLETRDLEKAEAGIAALVKSMGGYVSSSSNSVAYLSMVIRVPQLKFEETMAGLKGEGKLKSRSESVEDVTLQYVDMASRIETKKILKERYTEYLKRAGKVDDLLSVEKALNEVIADLDSMEASFKALSDQISYATISVSVDLPPEATASAQRSFLGGLAKVWDRFVGFLYFIVYALAGLALFGVPSVLVVGLLYWLCFGKIGLVRKFFALLSGKP